MRFGLRARLLLSLLIITLGAIASVGAIAIWRARQALESDRVDRVARLGDLAHELVEVATDGAKPLEEPENRARLERLGGQMARAVGADELVFYDAHGVVIAPADAAPFATDTRGIAAALVGVAPHAEERPGRSGGLSLVTYARVRGGANGGVVRGTFSVDLTLDTMLVRARTSVLWLGAADGLVLLLVAAWILRGAVVRPVQALERAARRVADGDLEAKVEVRGPGELAALADAFEQMTISLRTGRESLIRSEKLAGVGRLAAGVAHEVGNPLAAILGYVEMLLDDGPTRPPIADELRKDILTRVRAETQRIHRIIQELLEYARPPRAGDLEAVSVRRVVDNALALVKAQTRFRELETKVEVGADLPPVRAATDRLTQVVLNLLVNAADATDGKGSIEVRARAEGERVVVTVSDDGPGVPESARRQIFDPFFSTKDPGRGTGLGLSVSLAIIEGYGGSLRLVPVEKGACFEVSLPQVAVTTETAKSVI